MRPSDFFLSFSQPNCSLCCGVGAIESSWQAPLRLELIANGLNRDKSIIAFPRIFTLLTRIGALLPERVQGLTARSFRFKVTQRE